MRLERLLHMADLHFGEHAPVLPDRLAEAVNAIGPELVVVTGDVTMRARTHQFRAARAFLESLAAPYLVVPGNHDIPLLSLRRLVSPYGKYRGNLSRDLEPEVGYDNALVSGLNTTANWRWKEGWLRQARRELRASGERLAIFAAHHPLGRMLEGRLDPRRRVILLHGHHHRATTRVQGRVLEVGAGSAFSPRIRDAHNGFNLLRIDAAGVTVEPHSLHAEGHRHLGNLRFETAADGWQRRS